MRKNVLPLIKCLADQSSAKLLSKGEKRMLWAGLTAKITLSLSAL